MQSDATANLAAHLELLNMPEWEMARTVRDMVIAWHGTPEIEVSEPVSRMDAAGVTWVWFINGRNCGFRVERSNLCHCWQVEAWSHCGASYSMEIEELLVSHIEEAAKSVGLLD